MQAAGGGRIKTSETNAAMVQGLFGGAKIDNDADHQNLVEQLGKRTVTTQWDMQGATPENILEKLDDDTRAEYTLIFEALDEDGSGEITVSEMAQAFRTMGLLLTNAEIKDLVLAVDQDSNGIIDLGEFCLMMYQIETGTASKEHLQHFEPKPPPAEPCCKRNYPALDEKRNRMWALCDDPSSSKGAQIISICIMTLIMISCTAFVWETDPNFHRLNPEFWDTLEAFCTACFTIEYLCRILSAPNLWNFLFDAMNTIDFIAIVPFYIELVLAAQVSADDGSGDEAFNSQSLRAFRLFRVFRLFKIGRHVSWLRVFSDTYVASFPPLIMIIFVMSIIMVFLASLAHTIEAPVFHKPTATWTQYDGTVATLQSIPDGFWYAIVSLTTVGYGDVTLATPLGRILSMMTSLAGIMVLAIPISVISLNFHDKYEANDRRQTQQHDSIIRLKALREEMETNKSRGVVTPINREGDEDEDEDEDGDGDSSKLSEEMLIKQKHLNRAVVSLLHASADRCLLSMKDSQGSCLIAEEHNRMDLRHELKTMLEQWEPVKKMKQLMATRQLRKSIEENGLGMALAEESMMI